jgi:HECT-domain (ubiquitin-transferase)
VIPREVLSVFDEDELDFLLEGVQELNLEDWKTHTLYKGSFTPRHKVVKWFWEIMSTYSQP